MPASTRGTSPQLIDQALKQVRDQQSFIQKLLIDALSWEIPETAQQIEDIAYGWSQQDLRASELDKHLVEGSVWQLQRLSATQPWGVFLLEFKNDAAFVSGRGMTGPLRKVLRGLVPKRRHSSGTTKTWKREHLLFFCTHQYQHFRVCYFKSPPEKQAAAPLAAFGWNERDEHIRTLCEFNLPKLVWPRDSSAVEAWVAGWTEAFDVEKVTKKFYEEYAAAFTEVEGKIKSTSGLKDAEELRLFTQTLFNRLMFLRFIERKGWLEFNGRHDYLAALMSAGGLGGKSVYLSRIRELFFQGLAVEGKQQSTAIGKVPFLNGGLFEENDLDKKVKDVPDLALSPMLGGSGHTGLFYKFNFTVQESTPLDIEVAVDPEMLGKVFEELVTGRHESGSYYTPRPVVSFMCREALKGYLAGATRIDVEKIAQFVDRHDVAGLTIDGARKIAQALDDVRAVDPACGSGAYLLGLLHEIVDLYRLLYSDKLKSSSRELHKIKLDIIEKCLYGVDIDPFATNIAMLRLWLSLTVDSDEPEALPNLDFKIETGDSVTGPDPSQFSNLFLQEPARQLAIIKGQYLRAHGDKKQSLRRLVHHDQREIAAELHSLSPGVIDWRVQFCEIFFSQRAGFDIVLANPPYIRQELIKALKPALKGVYQHLYSGTADLYVFFYLRGLQLLAPGGMLVYISSNKWFRAGYGEKLRAHIAKTTTVQTIVDFHDLPVFEAIAYPMIFIAKKQPPTDDHTAILAEPPDLEPPYPNVKEVVAKYGHAMPKTALGRDGTWQLAASSTADRLAKMRAAGPTLFEIVGDVFYRGIVTGLNSAFYVDEATANSFAMDKGSFRRLLPPAIHGENARRYSFNPSGLHLIRLHDGFTLELLGYDLGQLSHKERRLLVTSLEKKAWKALSSAFPRLSEFLARFEYDAAKRDDRGDFWWELRPCDYYEIFAKRKIVFPQTGKEGRFTLDTEGVHLDQTVYTIVTDDLFLLAVLNSEAVRQYLSETTALARGGYLRFLTQYLKRLPIPIASAADRSVIAAIAQKCLDARGVACEAWEKEIDERVAALYGLDAADLGDVERGLIR